MDEKVPNDKLEETLIWKNFISTKIREVLLWAIDNTATRLELTNCKTIIQLNEASKSSWSTNQENEIVSLVLNENSSDPIRICAMVALVGHTVDRVDFIAQKLLMDSTVDPHLHEIVLLGVGILRKPSYEVRELVKDFMESNNKSVQETAEIVFTRLPAKDEYVDEIAGEFSNWLETINPDNFNNK